MKSWLVCKFDFRWCLVCLLEEGSSPKPVNVLTCPHYIYKNLFSIMLSFNWAVFISCLHSFNYSFIYSTNIYWLFSVFHAWGWEMQGGRIKTWSLLQEVLPPSNNCLLPNLPLLPCSSYSNHESTLLQPFLVISTSWKMIFILIILCSIFFLAQWGDPVNFRPSDVSSLRAGSPFGPSTSWS